MIDTENTLRLIFRLRVPHIYMPTAVAAFAVAAFLARAATVGIDTFRAVLVFIGIVIVAYVLLDKSFTFASRIFRSRVRRHRSAPAPAVDCEEVATPAGCEAMRDALTRAIPGVVVRFYHHCTPAGPHVPTCARAQVQRTPGRGDQPPTVSIWLCRQVLTSSPDVIRYLAGHEVGHVVGGRILWSYLRGTVSLLLSIAAGLAAGLIWTQAALIAAFALIYLAFLAAHWGNELACDRFAQRLTGQEVALGVWNGKVHGWRARSLPVRAVYAVAPYLVGTHPPEVLRRFLAARVF